MARAGKPLDPWQVDSVTLLLAVGSDGLWACFEYVEMCSRQNGKGAILEARALAGFLLLGEQLIMWSAHQYKTAKDAFRRMRSLFRTLGQRVNDNMILLDGIYIKIHNTHGEEGFERLDTEARIKFIARSKDSGRGMTGDLNIIDEAYDYTVDQQEALGPTLLAVPNPQFVYTSSPPLSAHTGEILYGLRERAEQMLSTGVEEALGYRDWGLEGNLDNLDAIDVDDHSLWAAANPALCNGRLTIAKIAKLKKMLRSARGFARECLGLWPVQQTGGGLVDPKVWTGLARPDARTSKDVTFAFEVAHDRSYSTITAYSPWENGGLGEIVDRRPGTDWVVKRLLKLREKWDPVAIGVDGKGPALSLVLDCESAGIKRPDDPLKPARGDLMVLTLHDMAAALGQALDAMAQGALFHLEDPDLTAAALNAKTRPVGDVEVLGRRNAAVDISPFTGVTVARRVHMARIDLIGQEEKPKRVPMAAWA